MATRHRGRSLRWWEYLMSLASESTLLRILIWPALAALLIAGGLAAIGGLNYSLYSAESFVQRYLNAVARGDMVQAIATPGVALDAAGWEKLGFPADTSTALLRDGVAVEGPQDIRITADTVHTDGTHTITVSYRVKTVINKATFDVAPIAPMYGLLNRWKFVRSPLGLIEVTAAHNPLFNVGKLTLDTRAHKTGDAVKAFTQQAPYLAVAPAAYNFNYHSELLDAHMTTAILQPGQKTAVTVDAQPTADFVSRVQNQLDSYLNSCVSQQVLNPTGCPFGIEIDDRVIGLPTWKLTQTPKVVITADQDAYTMAPTQGTAQVSVEVQSLFDGSKSQLVEDRQFTVSLDVMIKSDGSISVRLQ